MKVCPVCSREFVAGATLCPDDGVALVALSSAEAARPEDLIGKVVEGRYKVERIVGKGGMGTVYACRHVVVGKSVALKVLRPSADRAEGVLQRFIREAQTTNLLKSRHIVEVTDFGQLPNGLFFVVMELLEGQDLSHAMRSGRLSRADLIHIFIQIAETLARAHELGVVHRDLKPDNVFLVNEAGDPLFVKLLDFGIAKLLDGGNSGLTETGVILGTPYYMSPEQARADAVDHRTDIYALGVIMYRAFTGRLPFIADSTMGVITRHLSEPPEPPSKVSAVHPKAEVLILRCLEKRPELRPQSMREVAAELRVMLGDESSKAARRPRDNTTVSERPPAAIAASTPIPAMPVSPTTGAHARGAYPSGPHGSGSYPPAGPQAISSYPPGSPHASGQHLPSGEHAFDPRAVSGRISGVEGIPRVSSPPTFDSALTSVRWPPGTTGATGRGFVTSSVPTAATRSNAWMLLSALLVFAAGVIAAALFFASRSSGPGPTQPSVTAVSVERPSTTAPAASTATAVATAVPAVPAPAPPSAATPSASAQVTPAPPRPRPVGPVAAPPKPTTSATTKRPGVEIRSPFD